MRKLTNGEKLIVLDVVKNFVEDLIVMTISLELNEDVLEGAEKMVDSLREFTELVVENTVSE